LQTQAAVYCGLPVVSNIGVPWADGGGAGSPKDHRGAAARPLLCSFTRRGVHSAACGYLPALQALIRRPTTLN